MENMHTDVRGYRVKDLSWHAVRMGEYGRYVLVKNLKQSDSHNTVGSRTLSIARHYPPQAEPVFHITIDTQPFLITKFFIKNGDDSIIILLLG